MRKILSLALAAFLCIAASSSGQAAPQSLDRYTFDPAHTQVFFVVNHWGFSNSHGRFKKFSGDFKFDPARVTESTVNVEIATESLDMGTPLWDEHVKGKDFFNVKQHPTMTFRSTKIEKNGEKTGKLTGDLTLLGVTKPVTLDVTWNKSAVFPMNRNYVSGFSATGKIKRSDFGMNAYVPMIGDEIALDIQVEGVRQEFDQLRQ